MRLVRALVHQDDERAKDWRCSNLAASQRVERCSADLEFASLPEHGLFDWRRTDHSKAIALLLPVGFRPRALPERFVLQKWRMVND